MEYDQFIAVVQGSTGSDRDAAEAATRATLGILGDRLGAERARPLAARLPADLAPWLDATGVPDPFDAATFVRRLAELLYVDLTTAERYAVAVLVALARAVPDQTYRDLEAALPPEYGALLRDGTFASTVGLESFLIMVGERARTDVGTARRATEAVLETLGERITSTETERLLGELPLPLHAALKRGAAQADAATNRMPAEAFVGRVGRRAGLPPEQALECTRSVFVALRDAIADRGFFDVTVQLPGQYRVLLAAV
jgi:uncharacterized protein (DUF2267 family)